MEISQIERRPRTRLDGLGFITFRDGKEEEDGLAMPRRGCRGRGDGRREERYLCVVRARAGGAAGPDRGIDGQMAARHRTDTALL
jgi:hypothetical protein